MPDETVTTNEPQSEGVSFEAFKAARISEVIPPAESKAEPAKVEAEETKTAEDSDSSKQQETERDEHGKFKPKEDSVQKRIDKSVAKQREAERRADDAERRLAELQAAKPAEVTTSAEKEPTEADYTDYNKFVRDLAKWEARQLIASERKADNEARTKAEQEKAVKEIHSAYQESEHQAKEAHDDYAEVLDSVADITMPPAAQIAILHSDSKAELAYYLAKDRAELERIVALPPYRLAMELGKIEAKLEASKPVKAEKKVTAAPKPPKPVGGAAASSNSPEDALNYGDFKARRAAQLANQ